MRTVCPKCEAVTTRLLGNYEITATSALQFSCERDTLRPAVAPLELTRQSFIISKVTCPDCGYKGSIKEWLVIIYCAGCGEVLAKKQAGLVVPAPEYYCNRESNFLCRRCATRYGSCSVCDRRTTCQIIIKEEEE